MRHALFGFRGAAFFATVVIFAAACSSSGKSGPDRAGGTGAGGTGAGGTGTGATGAGATGGAGPACADVNACGGSVVGAWKVSSSCLSLAGDLDGAFLSLGCSKVPMTGTLTTTGTFTANADGTYTDNTVTTGSASMSLGNDCLTVSSVTVTCERAADAFSPIGLK
ncbi:MAG: hypothetical protein ABIQ16_19310, partial [Polyangiaceae bacterium]